MAIDATLVVGEANASSSLTTTAQTTTNGRKFALCVSWDAGQTITGGVPSDSKSNTWSALGSQQADGNGGLLRWFITTTSLGGSSHTFTVAFSGTAYQTVSVYELTDAGDVDVQTQSQDSGGQPFTMATGALAQAAEVVLVAVANNTGGGSNGDYTVNATSPSGTLLYSQPNLTSYWTHGVAKYLPSSTSSFNPSFNRTGSAGGTSAISIISIKESAGGGGGTTITPPAGSVTLSGTAPTVTTTNLSRDLPTYVGGASQVGTGATITVDLTALSGGSDSSPSEGDLVVVVWGHGDTTDRTLSVSTSGYTKRQDLYQTETWDPNLATAWKFMGSTPDSSVVVNRTSNAAYGGAAVVHVWRGVDPNVPFDVADTTATGTNSQLVNSPSITPLRENSVILVAGIGTQATTGAAFTIPAGYSTNSISIKSDGSTSDAAVFIGSKTDWTSGAFDPAAVTGGTGGTSAGWIGVTMALRGAISDASIEITPPAGSVALISVAPTVIAPLLIRPSAGSLTAIGSAPVLSSGSSPVITPASASIGIVSAIPHQTYTLPAPQPAGIVFTSYAPTRTVGASVAITPANASLVAAAVVPTVTRTQHIFVTPPAASVVAAAVVPTVTRTQHVVVTPPAASVQFGSSEPFIAGSFTIRPAAASVGVISEAPNLGGSMTMRPAPALIVLGAASPSAGQSYSASPLASSLVVSATAPTALVSLTVRPPAGSLVFAAAAPGLNRSIAPPPATIAISSAAARLSTAVTPPSATVTVVTQAPIVGGSYVARPPAAAIALSAETPDLGGSVTVRPPAGSVTVMSSLPEVGATLSARPNAAALLFSSSTPTLTLTANRVLTVPAAEVLLGAEDPIIVRTDHHWSTPDPAELLFGGTTPESQLSDAVLVRPEGANLLIGAFSPAITITRYARIGRRGSLGENLQRAAARAPQEAPVQRTNVQRVTRQNVRQNMRIRR